MAKNKRTKIIVTPRDIYEVPDKVNIPWLTIFIILLLLLVLVKIFIF